jgi:hypothetical protein
MTQFASSGHWKGVRAASGGKPIFLDNPMQRMFRDIHPMRAHAMNNSEKVSRMLGRFDLDPNAAITEPGETSSERIGRPTHI